MKPIKQRNSEDIAFDIEKRLRMDVEIQLNWIIEHLDQYESARDLKETMDGAFTGFDDLLLNYQVAKEREARQEYKTGEDEYKQATGGY